MKIIFAGTPHFAAVALDALLETHEVVAVLTQPDKRSGRGMQISASPVKQMGLLRGIPVLQIPKYGCLNIHASLLPRWRGAAPIQRAILAGDTETGITIMQMDEGLDTGDMLTKMVCSISNQDTSQSLHEKLAELGALSIVETLKKLEKNQLQPERQKTELATYAAKLSKAEANVDWTADADQLNRNVRGYFPYPVASTMLHNTPIKIIRASLGAKITGDPGKVVSIDKQGIQVTAGTGSLVLEVLQKPGGKALPIAQFIQTFPIEIGERFGEI